MLLAFAGVVLWLLEVTGLLVVLMLDVSATEATLRPLHIGIAAASLFPTVVALLLVPKFVRRKRVTPRLMTYFYGYLALLAFARLHVVALSLRELVVLFVSLMFLAYFAWGEDPERTFVR